MDKQRGVVLILAMLIVVMVTTITISLSWRYNLSLTRSENRWHGMQARAYLEGAETLAAVVLREDFLADQDSGRMADTLNDIWAQSAEAFPTDEGWVRGKIEDAQGRLNLNLLEAQAQSGQGGQQQGNVPLAQQFTEPQKRFIRLLQTFEFEDGPIDPARAIEITEAVIDWIDGNDSVKGFGGAEQSYYQQLDPPATPPNLPMISVSELRRIKGMTEELYRALLPLVIALPPAAKLNINTMPLKLMQTINDPENLLPLAAEDAQLLLEERDALMTTDGGAAGGTAGVPSENTSGFDSVDALKTSPILTSLITDVAKLDTSDLTVQSDFFLLFSDTQVGEQIRSGASMLKRTNGQVQVVRRTDAHF